MAPGAQGRRVSEASNVSTAPLVRLASWLSAKRPQPRWLMLLLWFTVYLNALAGLVEWLS